MKSKWVHISSLIRQAVEEEEESKEAALKKLDDKERPYRKQPNYKPPRRQHITPISETRDYGREYMQEYRAEGRDNNSYIPKGKRGTK